ncbi:hypothetical protein [Methanonatronarchaeum sp. AMET-Sl]|uniref:hypothetical protein n=1 Tax=Methanonatronarchaeum sp. AMET-Sl TaxID=3037654 RepID=UPI00244DDDEE|nr:hypothetical protein [Methanonatronarchaeum sp. AMET-Sl]WGI17656.1 hypothetical protein QEN48_01210 [Methanonatronarchaeum sp. AMET-Sl]
MPISNRYKSLKSINSQLKSLDDLYNDIKNNGYKTQRELLKNDSGIFEPTGKKKPEIAEVTVNIGRDGEFIFDEGRHRFCIAKTLNLEIPVRVFLRHKKWQKLRKEVSKATEIEDLSEKALKHLDHPDMEDIKKPLN